MSAVCADIAASAPAARGAPLQTVFFGGGTPSLLPPAQLGRILAALRTTFGVAGDAEVSMEADPGTFDADSLAGYVGLGVSRVSLGVQAFDAAALAACGRAHSVADVEGAVALLAASPGLSWGCDLLAALPHATPAGWAATLAACVAAGPHSVSVYDLQVEEGTAFARRGYTPGAAPLPADDDAAEMYRSAHAALTAAGYEHYEVSNYARPGHACRHNLTYWRNGGWHAFGCAAAAHVRGRRFTRPRRLRDYLAWVGAGCQEGPLGAEPEEEALLDTLLLGLRTAEGVDLEALARRWGARPAEVVRATLERHGPRLVAFQGGRVRLTAPDGFMLSNTLLADVFAKL